MRECRAVFLPHGVFSVRVLMAECLADRLRGLLGREPITDRYALWISPCCLVHTFGMRAAIDLAFVDRRGRIVRTCADVAPGRVRGCAAARGVLEFAAGSVRRLGLDRPAARVVWTDPWR